MMPKLSQFSRSSGLLVWKGHQEYPLLWDPALPLPRVLCSGMGGGGVTRAPEASIALYPACWQLRESGMSVLYSCLVML